MKKGEPVGSLYFAPHGLLFCRLVQVRLIEGSFEKSNTGREGLAPRAPFFTSTAGKERSRSVQLTVLGGAQRGTLPIRSRHFRVCKISGMGRRQQGA